ncbi:MAG: hypothetical protein GC145_15510 [Caulobacter sp.]|nr:hypothetical protein [Caulobacter sp.]
MKKTIFALAALLAIGAGTASSADLTLNTAALQELARSGQPLCGGWRAHDDSCEDIGFMDLLSANQVRQTYHYRLSLEPDLQIVMQETSTIEGDALCSIFDFDKIEIAVLLDGAPAPAEQTAAISAILEESVAEYAGRKTCESFARDPETGQLVTRVTVDGERDPDLESTYRPLAPQERIHLRAPDEGPDLMPLPV